MPVEVDTAHGRIRGTEVAGIRAFLGVPYAAPLRGAARFLPPEPPEPWTGVRDAIRPGPAAPQFSLPVFSWINLAAQPLGDDCLTLNVWTPGPDDGRRPVLVWIHGGGFLVGGGATPVYNGHDLARRGDAVVVTINYRLGALGYGQLGTMLGGDFERSTNLGVRDQIAALEWVRDHAEQLGGDPDNVTVFGQSAGAMSIAALLGAPRARALFHRAICMSGAADHVVDHAAAREIAAAFLEALGGPPPSLDAFARIPTDTILAAQRTAMMARVDLGDRIMLFLPAVDGDVIPEQPLDALRRGAGAHIPILTGATLEEWKLFRAVDQGVIPWGWDDVVRRFETYLPRVFPAAPDARTALRRFREALGQRSANDTATDVWSAFQTARVFHAPMARLADAHHAGGGRAYSYLFTWRPPALRRVIGCCHGLDIPFVFGSTGHPLARPLTGLSAAAGRLARKMQHAWLGFARDGSPGHERLPLWPAHDPARRATMVFGRDCSLAFAPLDAERRLLDDWRTSPARHAASA